MTDYRRFKESTTRRPVDENHEMVAGAIRVLQEQGGGPMSSVAIFRRGVELGVFEEHQYNTLRARLSQHCDLPEARVVRARGSKVGIRGSRTTGWVLSETGLGVRRIDADAGLVVRQSVRPGHRGRKPTARNVILDDNLLAAAPDEVRVVAGRTAREALVSALDPDAVEWLLTHLPLEEEFRDRLRDAVGPTERERIIRAEERKKRGA